MAGNRYLSISGDHELEVAASQTSVGVGSAGVVIAAGAAGTIDPSFMPPGIGADQLAGTSNGAITARDICYVETAGTIARATAAAGTPQAGIGWALTSVATASPVTIQLQGIITGLTGLTPGARYFLSNTTPGAITATPPSATGELWQYVGRALTATSLQFEPDTANATIRA